MNPIYVVLSKVPISLSVALFKGAKPNAIFKIREGGDALINPFLERHRNFTPSVKSTDGLIGREEIFTLKRLCGCLKLINGRLCTPNFVDT